MTDPNPRSAAEGSPQRLTIGRIVGPHGIRGEFRMFLLTQFPERIPQLPGVYIGEDGQFRKIRRARLRDSLAIMLVEGIDSRDDAEARRNDLVRISLEHAAPLEEGEFFHFQILGLQARDEDGNVLGEVVDIIETGANDVYVIRDLDGNEMLIPALHDVVPEIDPDAGTMTVRPQRFYDEA
jgi:16S rRNA processing protein RimM